MLQANRIVIGTISLIGQTYSVIARIVDVESGKTIRSADRQYKGEIDKVLVTEIPEIGNKLMSNEVLSGYISVSDIDEEIKESKTTQLDPNVTRTEKKSENLEKKTIFDLPVSEVIIVFLVISVIYFSMTSLSG